VIPHIGGVADDLCLIRSMHTGHNNHTYYYSAKSYRIDPPPTAKVCSPPGVTEGRAWTSHSSASSSPR
jgi:hypothetical protein